MLYVHVSILFSFCEGPRVTLALFSISMEQDDLQWSNHRPAVDGQFVLSLAGHFYTYLIGLAVFRENGETSGIHWFKCVYDLEKGRS